MKLYIGDAVYIVHDGYHFILTTEDGTKVTNTIYLEPEHLDNIMNYAKRIYDETKTIGENDGVIQQERPTTAEAAGE